VLFDHQQYSRGYEQGDLLAYQTEESVAVGSGLNPTRSGELRERIEEQIAVGKLRPGQRLDENELAEEFGVSRTPIREALIQLASVGILEMRPRRGAIVPDLSPERIFEMFEVMAEMEAICGRLAARRMSQSDHDLLLAAHKACETARSSGSADEYYAKNEVFHQVIYAGSHNAFLRDQALTLHKRLRPQRRLQLRVRERIGSSFAEHEKIVKALLMGQADLSADLLRQHVLIQGERFTDLMAMLKQVTAASASVVA
jgi:DNA-binding GntR family transcriptional regulator